MILNSNLLQILLAIFKGHSICICIIEDVGYQMIVCILMLASGQCLQIVRSGCRLADHLGYVDCQILNSYFTPLKIYYFHITVKIYVLKKTQSALALLQCRLVMKMPDILSQYEVRIKLGHIGCLSNSICQKWHPQRKFSK